MREQTTTGQKCPGEENCQDWSAAAGETHEEKEQAVCVGCHLFQTKHGSADEWLETLLDEIEYLRYQQKAGRDPDLNEISPLAWEGLVLWHREEARVETDYKTHIRQLMEALFTRR